MKIAIFTLTRDRFFYTKYCFGKLMELAGYPYDHFIVDNGSTDETQDWIVRHDHYWTNYTINQENLGLCAGNNQALDMIRRSGKRYNLIAKFDNDAEVITPNIVAQMAAVFEEAGKQMLLSPRVTGISRQPIRTHTIREYRHEIGITNHIGGLFSWASADLYMGYTYPNDLPLASGDDSAFAYWVYQQGCYVGYVEDLVVNHYETTAGQAERYPEYFERKRKEETILANEKIV